MVTLALSAYVLPEDLYPWLNLASGCMVLVVGIAVLRSRARAQRHAAHHGHSHDHGHSHSHDHGHSHGHGHGHGHDRRGILAMGVSAGLIPCPSALVVLLGAIAQHEVALGLLLITAFSAGLAATLTVLGVLVVKAARLPMPGRIAGVLPGAVGAGDRRRGARAHGPGPQRRRRVIRSRAGARMRGRNARAGASA